MSGTNPLRQKMINMMYLVLTALLALNVSADILKAFALVNKGMNSTNESYQRKTALTMSDFKRLYETDRLKAEKQYTNAKTALQRSDELYQYIEDLKENIAVRSGGWTDRDKKSVVDDQNLETAQRYFIEEKRGELLRNKLLEYEKEMNTLSDNNVVFELGTVTPPVSKDGVKKSWSEYYFEGVPAVAALTMLTKFQNDIRNAEAEVTNYNYKRVNYKDNVFDRVTPVVSTDNSSVFLGDRFKAEVFLGAYNSTQNPIIEVNGKPVSVSDGKATIEAPATKTGDNIMKVTIKVPDKDKPGAYKEYSTDYTYQVYKGSANVSADAMNLLYTNVDNPISISVPGFRPDQIVATSTAGNLKPVDKEGHYSIRPPMGYHGDVGINVAARTTEGVKPMGNSTYKVRPIPLPEVILGPKHNGGRISRAELLTVRGVQAGLGAGFAFKGITCQVASYSLIYIKRNGASRTYSGTGEGLSSDLRAAFQNANTGDHIVVSELQARVNGETKIVSATYEVQ